MSTDSTSASTSVEEYAYYMPDWIWEEPSTALMKSMLLFFDKVTLALPEALVSETINRDPELAIPLADKGLLVNIDPSKVLDPHTARTLAETLADIVTDLPWSYRALQMELSPYHYGDIGSGSEAVKRFESLLASRGLITIIKDNDYEYDFSGNPRLVQLDPQVRLLVLTMFAQVFRAKLMERGIIIHPITDSSEVAGELDFVLRHLERKRAHHGDLKQHLHEYDYWYKNEFMFKRSWDGRVFSDQLSVDLLNVGADLSAVPLDEVLSFRQENMAHYVAYAASLREFLITQASLHPVEQKRAQYERSQQIQGQAAELRKIARSAFGIRSAGLLFALVGAAWTAKHGDIFGSLLSGLAASAQAVPVPEPTVTSYSYLLKTSRMR